MTKELCDELEKQINDYETLIMHVEGKEADWNREKWVIQHLSCSVDSFSYMAFAGKSLRSQLKSWRGKPISCIVRSLQKNSRGKQSRSWVDRTWMACGFLLVDGRQRAEQRLAEVEKMMDSTRLALRADNDRLSSQLQQLQRKAESLTSQVGALCRCDTCVHRKDTQVLSS